jgi:hypothetical protein
VKCGQSKRACKIALVCEARVKMQRNFEPKKAHPEMSRSLAREGKKENEIRLSPTTSIGVDLRIGLPLTLPHYCRGKFKRKAVGFHAPARTRPADDFIYGMF